MNPFIGALFMVGGICLSVAAVHLVLGLRGYQRRLSLFFSLAALAAAGDAVVSTRVYQASSVEDFAAWLKWSIHFQALFGIALVWCLTEYAGIKRRLFPWLITAAFLLHGIVHTWSPYGIQFEQISRLHEIGPPLGVGLVFGKGSPNPALPIGDLYGLSNLLFYFVVAVYLWRDNHRRKAVILGVSLAPMVLAITHGTLVDNGVIRSPYLFSFAFLSFVLLMSIHLVSDVVRSSKLSREIRASERRWSSLLEDVHLLVVGFDLSGRVSYINPRYSQVTGFDHGEVLGRHFTELLEPAEKNRILSMAGKGATREQLPSVETWIRTTSRDARLVEWSSHSIVDEEDHYSGSVSIGADITERSQAEAARDRAFHQLQDLKARLEEENLYLKEQFEPAHDFAEIVGQSDPIKYVLHMVQQVAATDATVLIEGETGVGKELVARALHEHSDRSGQPFIRVNCAALPAELVEAELFGHEKGAFTGADRLRKGRFELADGGTLFLDEIGDLPPSIQTKLLRVIQEREFERLGSSETRQVNVRLVGATNRSLEDDVSAGRFREDLFYRLNVYPITVPPLRQRREDIPLLVRHFVHKLTAQHRRSVEEIPAHLMRELTVYDWPGNVRELINVLERAVITSPGTILHLPQPLKSSPPPTPTEMVARDGLKLEEVERRHIQRVLESTGWRIGGPGGAAELLGLNSSTFRSRLKKLGIRRPGHDAAHQASGE